MRHADGSLSPERWFLAASEPWFKHRQVKARMHSDFGYRRVRALEDQEAQEEQEDRVRVDNEEQEEDHERNRNAQAQDPQSPARLNADFVVVTDA